MQLRDYLHTQRVSVTDLAKHLGLSRTYLSEIKNKKVKPSRNLCKIISMETSGKVTLDELLED